MKLNIKCSLLTLLCIVSSGCRSDLTKIEKKAWSEYEHGNSKLAIELVEDIDTDDYAINNLRAHYLIAQNIPKYSSGSLREAGVLLKKIRISTVNSSLGRDYLILGKTATLVLAGDKSRGLAELSVVCGSDPRTLPSCLKSLVVPIHNQDSALAMDLPRTAYERDYFLNDMAFRLVPDGYYLGNMLNALGYLNLNAALDARDSAVANGTYGDAPRAHFCYTLQTIQSEQPTKYKQSRGATIYALDCPYKVVVEMDGAFHDTYRFDVPAPTTSLK